ncbi:MAG: hypothetical protein MJ227_02200 [Bacilli bacterium]|nr:hypothetical protein [Bacilli bacterium]
MLFNKINSSFKIKTIIRIIVLFIVTFSFVSPIVIDGVPWQSRFIPFTGLSAFIIFLEYIFLVISTILKLDSNKKIILYIRLICTGAITLTFIIFGLMLTPIALATQEYNPFTVSSVFQHFVTPTISIVEFFLIDPTNFKIKKRSSFLVLLISIPYALIIEIRGAIIDYPHIRTGGPFSKYPYFFMDSYFMGWLFEGGNLGVNFGVIPILLLMVLLHIFLGYILVICKNAVSTKLLQN